MKLRQVSILFFAAMITVSFCKPAIVRAQYSGVNPVIVNGGAAARPVVSVSGTNTVKCLPDTVRLVHTLQSKGKTIDEALSKMKAEQNSIVGKLSEIGFAKERIRFDGLGIDLMQENKRRQLEAMIAQKMRGPVSKIDSATEAIAEPILLKCSLLAEYPLAGKTLEEILKETQPLKQQIKTVDFAPKPEELTPEEEELAEEIEALGRQHSDESTSGNEPRIVYVARMTKEQKTDAFAATFEQVRREAEFLANAAGAKSDALISLSGHLSQSQPIQQHYDRYQGYPIVYSESMIGAGVFIDEDDEGEADENPQQSEGFSMVPEPIKFIVHIQAAFALE